MIMREDEEAIKFISALEVVDTRVIHALGIYKDRKTMCRRLTKLYELKMIYRMRSVGYSGYFYGIKPFVKQPYMMRQYRHKMKRNELYLMMINDPDVSDLNFYTEQKIEDLRADGIIIGKYKGKEFTFILECETGSKLADLRKYDNLFYRGEWKGWLPNRPKIVWLMDQEIKEYVIYYPYVQIKWDLSDYGKLWDNI